MFTWPAVGLQVYHRTLIVTVNSAPNGPSAVEAWSQSAWIVPRPSAERVPSGVREASRSRLRIGTGVIRHAPYAHIYICRMAEAAGGGARERVQPPADRAARRHSTPAR